MSRKRDHIPLPEKLAACIGKMLDIPFEHLQLMTADQVLSLVQWDHYPIKHAEPYNGPDVHWNLVPRSIIEHRVKTATIDQPAIAKGRRLDHNEKQHRAVMSLPASERKAERQSRWAKGRKLQSRNDLKGKKHGRRQ
jgi:hypothetical protein